MSDERGPPSRVLILSNTIELRTGYGNVFGPIARYLAKQGHEVVYFGLQQIRPPYEDDGIVRVGLRFHPWGEDVLLDYLRAYRIHTLITGIDLFMPQVQYIPDTVSKAKVQWIAHMTVNHHPLSPMLYRAAEACDTLVVPSRFGYRVVREAGFYGDVYYIPHGIDLEVFHRLPASEVSETRERLRVDDKEFIAVSVMRNKGEAKNFPALFEGWRRAIDQDPRLAREGVLLVLTDPKETVDLYQLRSRWSLGDTLRFIWAKPEGVDLRLTWEGDPHGMPHHANMNFPASEMARLYNVASCHVITSSGESFNLPCIESQSCGCPQIFPNHTVGPELVGEPRSGLLVPVVYRYTSLILGDIFMADPRGVAEGILRLYRDPKARHEMSQRAVANASLYDWRRILPEWDRLVSRLPAVDYRRGMLGI